MNVSEQEAHRGLREKLQEYDPMLPLEWAKTIPKEWYLDPEIAQLEQEAVFGNSWQPVARMDQLSQGGCFVTTEVAGEPILTVRDKENESIHAFSNVCRHKATVIEHRPEGMCNMFACRYHRWTYNLDGRLHHAPEMENVGGFDSSRVCLPEFTSAEWGPLIWAHMEKDPRSLSDIVGPMQKIEAGFSDLCFSRRREYDVACNWKVFVENYLDGGYHVPTVHRELATALDYAQYRTALHPWCSCQSSPLTPSDDPGSSALRTGTHAQYWWLWPNTMINVYGGYADTNIVFPVAPDRSKVIFDFYFAPGTDLSLIERSVELADQVQREDIEVCEAVQKGLKSAHFSTGRFSRREAGIHHFNQLLSLALLEGVERREANASPLPRGEGRPRRGPFGREGVDECCMDKKAELFYPLSLALPPGGRE